MMQLAASSPHSGFMLILEQMRQIDELQRINMRTFQHHVGRNTSIERLFPAQRAQTPAVACNQTRKAVLWAWCAQIVAALPRKCKKFIGHFGAYDVRAPIGSIGIAATVAEVARHWIS